MIEKLNKLTLKNILISIGASTVVFVLYKLAGGFSSPFIAIFFLLFIVAAMIHYFGGILIAILGIADAILTFNRGGDFDRLALAITSITYIALAVVSFVYGRRLSKLRDERVRASYLSERLTQEKSKEENLLGSMADGVYAVDNDRRIVMFNKSAEQITGLSSQDVLDLHCYDVLKFHDDKGANFCANGNCPCVESWNTNKPVQRDFYYTSPEKKTISLAYSAAPIRDFKGAITGGIAIFRDVTKKKEVERMRNEFVSIASHEMRTPLFAIEGYLSLALRSAHPEDDKAITYVNKARSSVISMAGLLKNLLSFSKLEEGKAEVTITDFEIKDVIKECITTLLPKSDIKKIKLEFHESTTGELGKKALSGSSIVRADSSMMKEVVLNLIDNAIKFTSEGGVFITVGGDADFVKVCVRDSGPGIAKEDQVKLFQKFYRVDNTFTRTVGGTGLGLYLSREMVELAGGKIWADSDAGKGATFCFTLPRVKK